MLNLKSLIKSIYEIIQQGIKAFILMNQNENVIKLKRWFFVTIGIKFV